MTLPVFKGIFNIKTNEWQMPTGRWYAIDMAPYAHIPDMLGRVLVVHKTVPTFTGWVVTDAETGRFVGLGTTKKLAIENAVSRVEAASRSGALANFLLSARMRVKP